MSRKYPLSFNEYYHVYNRGTDKRIVFNNDYDRRRFQALLYLCNSTDPVELRRHIRKGDSFHTVFNANISETLVDIGAYCLMPNHFHILLYEKKSGGISEYLHKVGTSYTMYFNKKNERTGRLFEGPFKAELVDSDEYLNYIFSYIHLNPVSIINSKWKDVGIRDIDKTSTYVSNYHYSSYKDYFGEPRPESKILTKDSFPEHYAKLDGVQDLIEIWNEENNTLTKGKPW